MQAQRLLADARAHRSLSAFADALVDAPGLAQVSKDPMLFPAWTDTLRAAMLRDVELRIDDVVLSQKADFFSLFESRSVFVNNELAKFYGLPQEAVDGFHRVDLPAGSPRVGLLGAGAILATQAMPDRTSPVLRGKWLLNNIFGLPIPPPPPGVDRNLETKPGSEPASIRERLAQHRQDASCNGCHSVIDPLGFALENFDVIGGWRTRDELGKPVDSSGATASGAKVEGLAGLRSLLLARPEQFPRTMTEKLMAYAIGRRLEYYDEPAVRQIVRDASAQQYRWSSIILGIAKSPTFLMASSSPK